jgi:hypothetical protein
VRAGLNGEAYSHLFQDFWVDRTHTHTHEVYISSDGCEICYSSSSSSSSVSLYQQFL